MNNYELESAFALMFGGLFTVIWLFSLAIGIIVIIGTWKVFQKAGEPGWAAIVPFYNLYVMYKISFGNGLMFLLMLVPCVNVVMQIILMVKLAQAFGKSGGFAVGLILLNPIFLCILGFGDAEYQGVA